MPKQYEAIRDHLKEEGRGDKEAKRIAAATYNKQHPGHPMRPHRAKSTAAKSRKSTKK